MIGYVSETPIKTCNNVASMGATKIIIINTTYIINIYMINVHIQNTHVLIRGREGGRGGEG